MSAPSRFLSGVTQAASWQPLGNLGLPDPFFYAYFEDDFLPYNAALYTVTGTAASTAAYGSGGRVLLTTGAVAGNFSELQLTSAGLQYTAGKKLAFLTRIQAASMTTSSFITGLIATSATPFTAVADGIYFSKAAASTNITLTTVTGGIVGGTATITGALTDATDIDLGFYVDRLGNIKAFYGANLEGYKREDFATIGPNVAINAANRTGNITAVLLNPTIALSNGATAAAMTGVSDFLFAAQER